MSLSPTHHHPDGAERPVRQVPEAAAGVDYDVCGTMAPKTYDALMLASFGGPEGQEDVLPFLRNVTGGRGIPDERLEEVAVHYRTNGGVSPINAQNRALIAAIEGELDRRGHDLPVYWGNRNWEPYFPDTLQRMVDDGHRRILTVTTSAYSCYSSCRQYREDMGMAMEKTGLEGTVDLDKTRQYFNHPGFVEPFRDGLREDLLSLRGELGDDARIHVLFVTHSIPTADAEAAGPRELSAQLASEAGAEAGEAEGADLYSAQHLDVAREILAGVPEAEGVEWSLVYQSRSGSPQVPWLEPDINDAMEALAGEGAQTDASGRAVAGFVVVPLGFVSDHMEVIWDLDTEAKDTAAELGVGFRRTGTPGTDARFVSGLVDIVEERMGLRAGRAAVGCFPAWPDVCRPDCCVKVMRDGSVRPTTSAVDAAVRGLAEHGRGAEASEGAPAAETAADVEEA
ncbi:Ferrochelatase, protoheme ferro-lyase [Micrococcus lylae]|uniref:Coproporphyrin III ferrochelatase n=1 Tax=Micrococcus lylae TaxID=1273 RepID=A0A1R4IU31_9MICC|nr:Ferrochelatase, protoheme ferro-lyase [Micrococcus lylae]